MLLHQLLVGHDAVDEAHAQGVSGTDVIGGEHEFLGEAGPDQPGCPLGAAGAGEAAHLGFGEPEPGSLGGHPQVAGQRQFEATARGRSRGWP